MRISGDYLLVQWPDVQLLIDEPWFEDEAFLAQPISEKQDWVGPAAYFIPSERLNTGEVANEEATHL